MKTTYLHLASPCSFILIIIMLCFSSRSHQCYFPSLSIPNSRLMEAYVALEAWKLVIVSDPYKFTSNWCGPDVCNYTGVYCAPAPYDPQILTVAGIDLNHADIAGFLPKELGLLKDLAIFHVNSNRFFGIIPDSFAHLHYLYELDISNNQFSGPFPSVIFDFPSLIYLDIRFNYFHGDIPPQVFDLKLDALFINNNKFLSFLPDNLGNSPVSVFVAANNEITGCIPSSVAKMAGTLEEILLSNMELIGCFPQDIGLLKELKVLDVSFNKLTGTLPDSIVEMRSLEQLNMAHNKLSGQIPRDLCLLSKLEDFIYTDNYFSGEPTECLRNFGRYDSGNCIPSRPLQRSLEECSLFYAHPVYCFCH